MSASIPRRIVSGKVPFYGRLKPLEREALLAARDGKNAYDCLAGLYGRSFNARADVIRDLQRRELLEPIIGPRFATLTDTGRDALERNLSQSRQVRAPTSPAGSPS